MLLNELIDRYGEGAIVTVSPYVLASGETLRWILQIDGEDVPGADVRVVQEDPDWTVALLVRGDEQVEIQRWWTTTYRRHGPAGLVRRLGDLR